MKQLGCMDDLDLGEVTEFLEFLVSIHLDHDG